MAFWKAFSASYSSNYSPSLDFLPGYFSWLFLRQNGAIIWQVKLAGIKEQVKEVKGDIFFRADCHRCRNGKAFEFRQRLNNFSNCQCKHLLGYKSQWYYLPTGFLLHNYSAKTVTIDTVKWIELLSLYLQTDAIAVILSLKCHLGFCFSFECLWQMMQLFHNSYLIDIAIK